MGGTIEPTGPDFATGIPNLDDGSKIPAALSRGDETALTKLVPA